MVQALDYQQDHQASTHAQSLQLIETCSPGRKASAVNTYASYLKSVYTREKLPIYDKWPQTKSKMYINLSLIKKENVTKQEADQFKRATIHGNIDIIKQSKRAMDIGQIAKLPDGSHPKCILVEGAPGVGKSTFVWKLCHNWGKGKLLQQYTLIVLLRLRDKSVRDAKSISNLFPYQSHQVLVQQAAVEEIQRTDGKGVLLIFEGYDELPEEMRIKNSIFLDVITGKKLPETTVLVTSRPLASEFLHRECKRYISQHIEIMGFTRADIQSYLESNTSSDPSMLADLKKYISCYLHINSMMYIPLNAAIVVEVYQTNKKDQMLIPKTMTELYSSLLRCLLLRYLLDHPIHGQKKRWRLHNFSDLPLDVYQQLCQLGRIAYEGLLCGQHVFFSDFPEDFETLGLMHCVPELYADEGAVVSYHFLHLTLQEYLAAFHLSQQPVEEQITLYLIYCTGESREINTHFQMVLRFLSGIRKFSGYSSESNEDSASDDDSGEDSAGDDDSGEDSAGDDDSGEDSAEFTFDSLYWAYEAQDIDVVARFFGPYNCSLDVLSLAVTPFDCFVLGYYMSHSNHTWRISLCNCVIGDEGIEMLVRGAVEEEINCTGGFLELKLIQTDISSEGMKLLLKLPKQLINKMESLVLLSSHLNSESCATLAHLIPHTPCLKQLCLSFNPAIGQGGTIPLIRQLTTHNSVKNLALCRTTIDVDDCQALSELLSSSTSLEYLDVSCNDLPPECVELIISGLCHNTTLKILYMSYSNFSLKNTISLASVLKTNHTLINLTLSQSCIDPEGACHLANALRTNDKLQVLDLDKNPIGVKGAAAFARVMRKNKSLESLNLRDDSISEHGTQKLIRSLKYNRRLLCLPLKYMTSTAICYPMGSQVNWL